MSPMQSPDDEYTKVRLSGPKVYEDVRDEFKEACERAGVSQSEVLRDAAKEFIDEHGTGSSVSSEDGGYYPSDDTLRELYEACWNHAGDDLRIYKRRHASPIAEQTSSFEKKNLESALMPLRKKGFVALGAMPADLTGEGYKRRLHWHVKPPSADPEHWKYREGGPDPVGFDDEAWRCDDE